MRTNLPVSNNEVVLRDDAMIVSKTDLKGRITYINRDFLEISGFSESELIGAPHNLVRHPDMPPEAFEDLWATLQAGRPWTGYVKNRTKSGDYYWVLANVAPVFEGGQVVGYLSVRRKPSREMVATHEAAYRLFREKKQGNLVIRRGRAVKGGSRLMADWSVGARIGWMLGFLGFVVLAVVLAGMFALSRTNASVESLYEQRLEPVRVMGRIGKLMADNRSQILLSLQHDPSGAYASLHDHALDFHAEAVARNIAEITELWKGYYGSIRDDEEQRKLADAYVEARKQFISDGLLPARQLLLEGKFGEANLILLKKINPLYGAAGGKAEELFKYLSENSRTQFTASQTRYQNSRTLMIAAVLLLCAMGGGGAVWMVRSLTRPLNEIGDTLNNISQGNYSNIIDISSNNEMGRVLQGLQSMQTRMGFEVTDAKRQAEEMTRIKIGLYSSTAAITISDAGGLLIHMTPSAERLLQAVSGQDAQALIGRKLTESVLTDPQVQAEMTNAMQHQRDVDVVLRDRHIRLSARPILSERGEALGRVTQWVDRTAELAVEGEVSALVEAAAHGDFSQRLALEGKSGFYLRVSDGLNKLMEEVSRGLEEVGRVLNAVAQGALTERVDGQYQGTFGRLADDTNTTVGRLQEVVGRIKEATEAINLAAREIAQGNSDLSSRTEEQASSLEETASSMEQINATVKQNAENARQAKNLAAGSHEVVQRSGQMVGQVVDTMAGIADSSRKMSDIIGVIDSIAFQTNILALNAAVEAARAGEQGRGFAVVASEVRALAQRSATAAKEIKVLIAASVDKVEGGVHLVQETGRTMGEVVASFQKVAALVTEIASASVEQSSGVEQVTLAVGQMDEVTQQNAALVEQAAAAAESLEDQARSLSRTVSVFRLSDSDQPVSVEEPVRSAPKALPARSSTASPRRAAPATRSASPARSAGPARLAAPPGGEEEWEEF